MAKAKKALDEVRRLLSAALDRGSDYETRLTAAEKERDAARSETKQISEDWIKAFEERDAMRTERDRALGQLKCAEAAFAERLRQYNAQWVQARCDCETTNDLRSAIVRLALLLDANKGDA